MHNSSYSAGAFDKAFPVLSVQLPMIIVVGFHGRTISLVLVPVLGLTVQCAQVGDGVFEVLSTSGDTHLGGDDFDKRIVDSLASDFQKAEGVDLRKDRQALQRLTEAAEKAKARARCQRQRSCVMSQTLNIASLARDAAQLETLGVPSMLSQQPSIIWACGLQLLATVAPHACCRLWRRRCVVCACR